MTLLTQGIATRKESVGAALRALHNVSTNTHTTTLPALMPGLAESFAQLLPQLRQDVTALSLSFKPPITEKAAAAQLNKVDDSFGRLAACVVAATGGQAAGILVEEWKDGVEAVGAELIRLLDVFDEAAKNDHRNGSSASSSKDDNPYLLHTGLVWDRIDRIMENPSTSEVMAVEKRWRGQGDVMKDAWSEFKEFLEDAEDEDAEPLNQKEEDEEEDDEFVDEFDDFDDFDDLMKVSKLSDVERKKAEAVSFNMGCHSIQAKPLLGLYQILQGAIPRFLHLLVLEPEEPYFELLDISTALTAAFDSTIAALYPEQDVGEIDSAMEDISRRSKQIVTLVQQRAARSSHDPTQIAPFTSFLTKWLDRMNREEDLWKSRGISMTSLRENLPE